MSEPEQLLRGYFSGWTLKARTTMRPDTEAANPAAARLELA